MTVATKKAPARKPAETSSLDYLQHALERSGTRAGAGTAGGARGHRLPPLERIRQARKDLGARARDEAGEMQTRLEHASDDALREFGRAAVRAQRTPEALTEMQTEIRARKRTLLV